jgi:DNA-binding NtrC family response regulator
MESDDANPPRSITLYHDLVEAIKARRTMTVVCRLYACYVLACHGGNKSKAAEVLEMDRRTLHRWEKERVGQFLPVG